MGIENQILRTRIKLRKNEIERKRLEIERLELSIKDLESQMEKPPPTPRSHA